MLLLSRHNMLHDTDRIIENSMICLASYRLRPLPRSPSQVLLGASIDASVNRGGRISGRLPPEKRPAFSAELRKEVAAAKKANKASRDAEKE